MKKFVFLLFILLCSGWIQAQNTEDSKPDYFVRYSTYIATGDSLPFWMTTNQNGVFTKANGNYQLVQIGVLQDYSAAPSNKLSTAYGANLVYGSSSSASFHLNQYWLGFRYHHFVGEIGAKAQPIRFGGLSHTNGNMLWSNNARPLPGITLSTDGFIPVNQKNHWLSVSALYQENFLFDDRYAQFAHLHHKNLSGRGTWGSWQFTLGIDHWAYWGGKTAEFGRQPGWENYFRYILGIGGSNSSTEHDQKNVAGNSLGMYLLEVQKDMPDHRLTFYWNHPFEDRSGLELANIPDGLWGFHLNLKKGKGFTEVLYEFMNTTNQSGTYNMVPTDIPGVLTGRGNDNYFNNWIYKSGHTHYNRTSGTPILTPVIVENGISNGFNDTRVHLHHFGLSGNLAPQFTWKSLLTWSQHFGTYDNPFSESIRKFSLLAESQYNPSKLPLSFRLGFAYDSDDLFNENYGIYAGISYRYRQK